jgi:hypothetical protein
VCVALVGGAAYWFHQQHFETRFVPVESCCVFSPCGRIDLPAEVRLDSDSAHFTVEDLKRHGPGLMLVGIDQDTLSTLMEAVPTLHG